VTPPRWLVDEMLGRLARYLRFVGCDTAYGRDTSDDDLLETARREGRVLLTRDRALSRRSPSAFLLESPRLADQWRAVRAAWPSVPTAPAFSRCTLCNGPLARVAQAPAVGDDLPPAVRNGAAPLYACLSCQHRYWEGTHTARVRATIAAWEGGAEP
jgi:uncharacterized protein